MEIAEAKKNLVICGDKGRTAIYCKECKSSGYPKDGYLDIKHKNGCLTGNVLAAVESSRVIGQLVEE